MKREERIKFETLSLKAYGSKAHYKDLMDNGILVPSSFTTKAGKEIKTRAKKMLTNDELIDMMNEIIRKNEAELNARSNKLPESSTTSITNPGSSGTGNDSKGNESNSESSSTN